MRHAWFSQRKQPIIYTEKPPLLSNKNRSRVFLNQYSWLFARINKPEWKGNSSRSNWTHTTRQKKEQLGRPSSTLDHAQNHREAARQSMAAVCHTKYNRLLPSIITSLCVFLWWMFKIWVLWLNPGPSNNSRTWDTPLAHQPETKADQTPCPCLSLENY